MARVHAREEWQEQLRHWQREPEQLRLVPPDEAQRPP